MLTDGEVAPPPVGYSKLVVPTAEDAVLGWGLLRNEGHVALLCVGQLIIAVTAVKDTV